MKAKPCAILLMLSLLAVPMAAAAGDHDAGTIRLPADDGKADEEGRKPRPWECCDHEICNRKMPPDCRCWDTVKSCSANCEVCEPRRSGTYVCRDIYTYEIHEAFAPKCNPSSSSDDGK